MQIIWPKSIEPTGGSRLCLSPFVAQWRLPPVAHARRSADEEIVVMIPGNMTGFR
jgi:hypothetical protein